MILSVLTIALIVFGVWVAILVVAVALCRVAAHADAEQEPAAAPLRDLILTS
jgi:hypothetical protein